MLVSARFLQIPALFGAGLALSVAACAVESSGLEPMVEDEPAQEPVDETPPPRNDRGPGPTRPSEPDARPDAAAAIDTLGAADLAEEEPQLTPDPAAEVDAGVAPVADAGSDVNTAVDDRGRCANDKQLAVCLRFEHTFADDSPNNVGVSSSNVGFEAGPTGMAGRFHRSGGGIRVNESAQLDGDELTIELWVNPRSLPMPGTRAGLIDRDGRYALFILPGGAVQCIRGSHAVTVPDLVRVGVWSSLACTLDDDEVALFHEGRKVGDRSGNSPRNLGASGLSIGSNSPTGDTLDGLIDNVRVWRRLRNAQQICAAARNCR